MTHVKIESQMAKDANSGLRPTWEPAPFPATSWEGSVDLDLSNGPEAALEQVFRQFNRVTDEDVSRLTRIGYNLPSLSTGDLVTLDGRRWRVAPVGFREVVTADEAARFAHDDYLQRGE